MATYKSALMSGKSLRDVGLHTPLRASSNAFDSSPWSTAFAPEEICSGYDLRGSPRPSGAHATLAIQAGITGDAVARALGHESFAVTTDHYTKPEAVSGARTDLVLENLRSFRKSSAADWDAA
jgi:integrase